MTESKTNRGGTEREIRRKLLQAIFEQRMPPGVRLPEEALAETFDVSRTVIRQVIARMAQDGLLIKKSNGATCVAAPTKQEMRQILTVRKMVEPEIVRGLARSYGVLSFQELSDHLTLEDNARKKNDRATLVRLTGEFHLHLVELTKNEILIKLITGLQALTCLGILCYAGDDDACPDADHRQVFDALQCGNAQAAADLMLHHLNHIEESLSLEDGARELTVSKTLDWLSVRFRDEVRR
ncbi:GntR family transcriptional regulator [Bradyrhizobium sp. BR13661]|jgi:DNA-binding GntR family transcriptional regulator|uniref:GntR family transcriptional regulator n=1 Tax=Bradyrhizobium sp. BR13661 TaxID=2940622 RepID=UPI0024754372|nr:GntR family transcriptional regulator [Bradyrhizobium sp. BR13661]MDH6261784.1 DNA-binding GntR family transcriptional regulator [Bradyrhizobium sp. BR13661]